MTRLLIGIFCISSRIRPMKIIISAIGLANSIVLARVSCSNSKKGIIYCRRAYGKW